MTRYIGQRRDIDIGIENNPRRAFRRLVNPPPLAEREQLKRQLKNFSVSTNERADGRTKRKDAKVKSKRGRSYRRETTKSYFSLPIMSFNRPPITRLDIESRNAVYIKCGSLLLLISSRCTRKRKRR